MKNTQEEYMCMNDNHIDQWSDFKKLIPGLGRSVLESICEYMGGSGDIDYSYSRCITQRRI